MTTDEDIQILGIQNVSDHDQINEAELKLILCDALLIGPFLEPLLKAVIDSMPNYHGHIKQITIVKAMQSNSFL
jgi:hypothetical protein